MALNPDILRSSLALVVERQPMITPRFYEILFERYPQARPLFSRNAPEKQQKMLQDAIVAVVDHVEDAAWLKEQLFAMGVKHKDYNVTPEMFGWVGESLLATLAEIAGPQWSPEVAQAWTDAYGAISSLMLEAYRLPLLSNPWMAPGEPAIRPRMGAIIDGKAIAAAVREEVKQGTQQFAWQHGRPPGLTVVLVGDDPASVVYTRNKEKAAVEVGIAGSLHRLPAETTEAELLALLRRLNDDPAVDGILVQLPLPKHIRADAVLDAIDPLKDVDGFHPTNAGLLASGRPALVPCTPLGCIRLLREAKATLKGARAVVVGRSNIVGKPMAQLLLAEHATVTIAHSQTRDLAAVCREADVLVVAVGKAQLVRGDWVREGATVIDVGTNRNDQGKLVGDVAFDEVLPRAAHITPVPGGVGPMTIATLLANTLKAAQTRVAR